MKARLPDTHPVRVMGFPRLSVGVWGSGVGGSGGWKYRPEALNPKLVSWDSFSVMYEQQRRFPRGSKYTIFSYLGFGFRVIGTIVQVLGKYLMIGYLDP